MLTDCVHPSVTYRVNSLTSTKGLDTPGNDGMVELNMESCGGPTGILLLVVATTGVSRIAGLDVKRGNTASELEVGG